MNISTKPNAEVKCFRLLKVFINGQLDRQQAALRQLDTPKKRWLRNQKSDPAIDPSVIQQNFTHTIGDIPILKKQF